MSLPCLFHVSFMSLSCLFHVSSRKSVLTVRKQSKRRRMRDIHKLFITNITQCLYFSMANLHYLWQQQMHNGINIAMFSAAKVTEIILWRMIKETRHWRMFCQGRATFDVLNYIELTLYNIVIPYRRLGISNGATPGRTYLTRTGTRSTLSMARAAFLESSSTEREVKSGVLYE